MRNPEQLVGIGMAIIAALTLILIGVELGRPL